MLFEFQSTTRLVFGEGTFGQIGERAAKFGKKALLVTGRMALLKSGHVQRAQELLADAGVETELFAQIPANPTADVVDQGAAAARTAGCDLVIGMGGGSAMDAAKAIACCAGMDRPVRDFMVADAAGKKVAPDEATLPIICVTSTAGTASELTPFAVITLPESKEKSAIRSEFIQARVAIDDPELTYSAPPAVTAATGIDVLCHAVEAYVSTNATPVTDVMAQEAIRLVGKYLPAAVADGTNAEARAQMMLANAFAGYGLACCGATIMHGLEHPVSGHYPEVAHGAGLAAMLKPWARKLWPQMPERFARITELLTDERLADVEDAAARAEASLAGLLEQVGLNVQLRDLGVELANLPTMAADTCRYMAGAVKSTPGALCAEEVLELLEAAY